MDECIPPVIRDSRWFMYPFFRIWFKNTNLKQVMSFKSKINTMTDDEFADLYRRTFNRSADRPTDLNDASLDAIFKSIDPTAETLIDIGCGRGYFLDLLSEKRPEIKTTGLDFHDYVDLKNSVYVSANIESMPFPDKSYDVVVCSHVIEHLKDLPKAIEEMKRVARKQIIIATPCQRYYYYTLDLHLHFFPSEYSVSSLLGLKNYECKKIDGDWLYIGDVS
jgi:ubiquinone/menaquinone biosynthesis C-methylase UbiE